MLTQKKSYRWVVLVSYMLVMAASQMLWLNFAPITETIVQHYQVNLFSVGLLTMVFPMFYTLLSIHAGLFIDRYGYKIIITIAALLTAVFASIRIFDSNFYWLLYGQIGIAIVQPFIVNSISKLVNDWFDENQTALATGLGTVGFFLGMLISLGTSAILTNYYGLKVMLILFACISWSCAFIFILFAKNNHQHHQRQNELFSNKFEIIKGLFKNKQICLLSGISFFAVGVFNALMTWMQPILAEAAKITEDQTGVVGALVIICGIVGSIIIPMLSDNSARRKPYVIIMCLSTLILIYFFTNSHSFSHAIISGSLLGFLFLPGYALLLTMTEESVDKSLIGTATGIIMMMGNAGSVVFGIATQQLDNLTQSWLLANLLMICLIFIATFMCLGLKNVES